MPVSEMHYDLSFQIEEVVHIIQLKRNHGLCFPIRLDALHCKNGRMSESSPTSPVLLRNPPRGVLIGGKSQCHIHHIAN